jgi:hypothetical protein
MIGVFEVEVGLWSRLETRAVGEASAFFNHLQSLIINH